VDVQEGRGRVMAAKSIVQFTVNSEKEMLSEIQAECSENSDLAPFQFIRGTGPNHSVPYIDWSKGVELGFNENNESS